jgi:hypothetical protein
VNGGGSMTDTIGGSSDAELLWAGEGYSAFASASATKTDLTISYMDSNRTVRYSHILTNPNYVPDDPVSFPSFLSHKVVIVSGALLFLSFMVAVGLFLQVLTSGKYKKVSTKNPSSLRDPSLILISKNTQQKRLRIIKFPQSKKQSRTGVIALPYRYEAKKFENKELTTNTMISTRSISQEAPVNEMYNTNKNATFHFENPIRSTSDRKVKRMKRKIPSPQSFGDDLLESKVLTMRTTPTSRIPRRIDR